MFDTTQRYSYSFPTNIRFGIGVIDELAGHLKANGLNRVLVVTDPNVAQLDFLKAIVSDLENQGLRPELYAEIHKNPVASDVEAGADAFHTYKCDSVVGIGGGAAMDVARAIVLRTNNTDRDLLEYDELIGGDQYIKEDVPYFVTVPTTSGTGSEVGRSAIISEDESKKKRILFHPSLLAKQVFADPELTYGLPPFITAATGMDALTHNIEAFLAKNYHPMAEGISLEGVKMITENLEGAVNNPTPENRSMMMMGSLMGAVAFQKGLGIVHSLAHPLSTLLDMHHGLANAIMIPYGMQFNTDGFEPQFEKLAIAMGLDNWEAEVVIETLFNLNESIGLPTTLGSQGVTEEHVEALSDLAINDFAHPNNPKPVTREDFKQLYLQAL